MANMPHIANNFPEPDQICSICRQ